MSPYAAARRPEAMTISKRIQLILVPPLLALLVAMAALLAQSWSGLQRTGAILDEIAAATSPGA